MEPEPQNKKEEGDFDYLLVLDFEATCEENVKLKPCSEIIEFPVRVVRLSDGKLTDNIFHHYIKPTFNPQLTKFCTGLTGITQEQVNNGVTLE